MRVLHRLGDGDDEADTLEGEDGGSVKEGRSNLSPLLSRKNEPRSRGGRAEKREHRTTHPIKSGKSFGLNKATLAIPTSLRTPISLEKM
jgi:hypothetical protein